MDYDDRDARALAEQLLEEVRKIRLGSYLSSNHVVRSVPSNLTPQSVANASRVANPRSAPVASPRLSVVRFHGRSTAWGSGSKEDRFRYGYRERELAEWLPRLRSLAGRTRQLHVLFNNCCGASAVHAAETMKALLDGTDWAHARVRDGRTV